ncbi:hypothetical protein BTE28158_01440 [Burkholderia territorii]|nr:hypothetical protein BTE28158_01440 [Burkholderia territorii]
MTRAGAAARRGPPHSLRTQRDANLMAFMDLSGFAV